MEFPDALNNHLDELTVALDRPGTDLRAILSVLGDDISSVVPSFLGLRMTLYVDGHAVTLTAHDRGGGSAAQDYLVMSLAPQTSNEPGSSMVFYAGERGAFDEFAADLAVEHPALFEEEPGAGSTLLVVVPGGSGITGLHELTLVNQAVGVLLDRGHTPEEARAKLRCHAESAGLSVHQVADQLLRTIRGDPAVER